MKQLDIPALGRCGPDRGCRRACTALHHGNTPRCALCGLRCWHSPHNPRSPSPRLRPKGSTPSWRAWTLVSLWSMATWRRTAVSWERQPEHKRARDAARRGACARGPPHAQRAASRGCARAHVHALFCAQRHGAQSAPPAPRAAGKLAGLDKKLSQSLEAEVASESSPLELSMSPVGPLSDSARCAAGLWRCRASAVQHARRAGVRTWPPRARGRSIVRRAQPARQRKPQRAQGSRPRTTMTRLPPPICTPPRHPAAARRSCTLS